MNYDDKDKLLTIILLSILLLMFILYAIYK
jgi:hypothetical protein